MWETYVRYAHVDDHGESKPCIDYWDEFSEVVDANGGQSVSIPFDNSVSPHLGVSRAPEAPAIPNAPCANEKTTIMAKIIQEPENLLILYPRNIWIGTDALSRANTFNTVQCSQVQVEIHSQHGNDWRGRERPWCSAQDFWVIEIRAIKGSEWKDWNSERRTAYTT